MHVQFVLGLFSVILHTCVLNLPTTQSYGCECSETGNFGINHFALKCVFLNRYGIICIMRLSVKRWTHIRIYSYDKHGKQIARDLYVRCLTRFRPKNITFIVALILLKSGDVETNPGPFPCTVCGEEVEDRPGNNIFCDMCKRWTHKSCTKLTDSEYKVISKPYLLWICEMCRPNITSANRLKAIEEAICDFKNTINKFEQCFSSQKKILIEHEQKINEISSQQCVIIDRLERVENLSATVDHKNVQNLNEPKEIAEIVNNCIEKFENNKARAMNVIVFGVRESSGESTNETTEDKIYVEKMLSDLNSDLSVTDFKFFRIGRKRNDSTTRPIKFIFNDLSKKWSFYNLYKKTRSGPDIYKKISFGNDRSHEQREEFKRKKYGVGTDATLSGDRNPPVPNNLNLSDGTTSTSDIHKSPTTIHNVSHHLPNLNNSGNTNI